MTKPPTKRAIKPKTKSKTKTAVPLRSNTLSRILDDQSGLLDSGDLDRLAQPDFLIGETFQRGAVTLLHGKYSTGKTQCAMAILGGIAYGDSWGEESFQRGLACFVGCENFEASGMRRRAWCLLTGHEITDIDNLCWYDGAKARFNILTDLDGLAKMIETRAAARKLEPMVVVIDHIRRALRGPGALGAKAAVEVMNQLEVMAKRLNAAVIVIAHTNKSNSAMAGPAIYTNYAQAEHAMIAEGGNIVRLCGIKQRDASPGDILFARRSVEVAPSRRPGGRAITSAALLFHSFAEAKTGQSKLDDIAYLVAVHMIPGEFLSFAEVCRRCNINVGGEQNKRLRSAIGPEWKKIVVGDVTKAIRRVKTVPPGETKEKELFQCAALDDLMVYPLSEPPAAKPSSEPPDKPDSGPKRKPKPPNEPV